MITRLIEMVLVFAIYAASMYIGWLIPNRYTHDWGLFDYKPFKCQKCLTTWLMALAYAAAAYIMGDWLIVAFGLPLTAMNTIALLVEEKNKSK